MADVIYTGAVGFVPQVKTYTLTGATAGAKWTVTSNGKSVSYTAVTGDTNDSAASALASALTNAPYGELSECSSVISSVTANQIVITGPTDGAPFTWTHSESGGAVNTEANPTAADGPHNAANVLNYSTGALPGAADRLILSGQYGPKYGLAAVVAAIGTLLVTDGADAAQVGLPDQNPRGYAEYRPKFFEVAATSIIISTNNQDTDQRVRLKSTAGGAVAVRITGPSPAQAAGSTPALSIDLTALPAGSTVAATNSTFAVSRSVGVACTVSTLTANGCVFYVGPSATVSGAVQCYGSAGRLLASFAGLSVDQTSAVSVELSAACSSGSITVDGGTLKWFSSGNPSAVVAVGNGGTVDFTGAPSAVAVTTFEMGPQSTLNNSTGKVTVPFDVKLMRCQPDEVTVMMPPNYKATWNTF